MNFRSIKDLSEDIRKHIIPKLPKDIEYVYGIARSGLLPASIIATVLGAKLGTAGDEPRAGTRYNSFTSRRNKRNKVLLVDDTVHGGAAMARGKALMKEDNFLTCAVYVSPRSKNKVDYYGLELPGPRMFEWNFLGIKATEEYMFDMDGVICTDPAVFDNDGTSYQREIISGVKPLYLPQVKIYGICTNRIERWRPETAKWLADHGVKYNELIMQPYTTAVERRKKSNPAEYKAQHYTDSSATLFVESHANQASRIAEISKKPVLCIETMSVFQ